jgi:hypothetical protein
MQNFGWKKLTKMAMQEIKAKQACQHVINVKETGYIYMNQIDFNQNRAFTVIRTSSAPTINIIESDGLSLVHSNTLTKPASSNPLT